MFVCEILFFYFCKLVRPHTYRIVKQSQGGKQEKLDCNFTKKLKTEVYQNKLEEKTTA